MPRRFVSGTWLDYNVLGRLAEGVAPIVLLHHGFGHAACWGRFPQRLHSATGRPVLAYSRQDCGRSDVSEGPRRPDFIEREANEALPALLASLGCERVCLYGHSDGASIALVAATRRPDLVELVVAEAPHVVVEPVTRDGVRAMTARFDEDEAFRRRVRRGHDAGERPFRLWSGIWLDPDFARWSALDDLSRLQVPALLLQGDADPFGSRIHVDLVRANSRGPVDLRIIEGAGHAPHRTADLIPGWVAAALSATQTHQNEPASRPAATGRPST